MGDGDRRTGLGTPWGRCRDLGVRGQDLVSPAHFLCVPSVPTPFCGDYVGLQRNPKLQKLKGGPEGPILMAETVMKVNRGNGKVKARTLTPLTPQPDPEPWWVAGRVRTNRHLPSPFPLLSLDFLSNPPPDQGACDHHRHQESPGQDCHPAKQFGRRVGHQLPGWAF